MLNSPAPTQDSNNLVWIDLEMTGLNPQTEVILQAALIVTNAQLEPLQTYCVDIWQPESSLETMVPFVREMHEKNGLLDRCRSSTVDVNRAEQEVLQRISAWCPYRPILCGNTIASDRKFIDRFMPALSGYLHYRMVDVSSLKVLAGLWHPEAAYNKPQDAQHDALFDIQESIKELAHYRKKMFRQTVPLRVNSL